MNDLSELTEDELNAAVAHARGLSQTAAAHLFLAELDRRADAVRRAARMEA